MLATIWLLSLVLILALSSYSITQARSPRKPRLPTTRKVSTSRGDLETADPQASDVNSPSGREGAKTRGTIFVCSNTWCREKGSDATMATFTYLSNDVPVMSVGCLGRCNKGPNVRILQNNPPAFVEASSVRSVDAVVALLRENLNLNINLTSAEVLKLNYEGNVYLRDGEVDKAIQCYDSALALGDPGQEGVLLIMRGSAILQRAYACRLRYRSALELASSKLPNLQDLQDALFALSVLHPAVKSKASMNLLRGAYNVYKDAVVPAKWGDMRRDMSWVFTDPSEWGPEQRTGGGSRDDSGKKKDKKDVRKKDAVRDISAITADLPSVPEIVKDDSAPTEADQLLARATFTFALYEHSLTKALDDLLKATVVLPGFAQGWRRAGDALSELQHFASAIEYYEVAIRLDPSLEKELSSKLERLRVVDQIVSNAEIQGLNPEVVTALISDSVPVSP